MPRLREYEVEALTYFYFTRFIPSFDFCTFRTDSKSRLRFCYRSRSIFPRAPYAEIAVVNKTQAIDGITYIKIKELKKKPNKEVVLRFSHYLDFFSRFPIWTGTYTVYLTDMPDDDFNTINSYVAS
jgi:hypothetical protein